MDKIKIVIADDSEEFREVLRDFLLSKNMFDVVAMAEDGIEAVQAVEKFEPDILILDIIMPNLDGVGVVQTLERKIVKKMPKIFVLSSIRHQHTIQKIVNIGINYYMIKPFNFDTFLEVLINMANGKAKLFKLEEKKDFVPIDSALVDLSDKVDNVIKGIGVPQHVRGYKYLKTAILEAYSDNELLRCLTTKLYPVVAKKHATSPGGVEKSIRAIIEITYNKNNEEFTNLFINYLQIRKKPSNWEFVSVILDKVKKEL